MPPTIEEKTAAANLAADRLEKATKAVAEPVKTASKAITGDVPHVTTGPVYQDSKRFSLTNALVNGIYGVSRDSAKFELDVLGRLRKAILSTNSLPQGSNPSALWLPMSWDGMGAAVMETEDAKFCKAVFDASPTSYDPDEAEWLIRKGMVFRKTQSAYTDNVGGTMIQPPTMGPVIPLIRPQAALLAAGAQQFTLPPQGRHTRPRVTGAPSVQAVAESQDAPESDLSTDEMVLTAKKIAGMARVSEEATLFSSGTIDAITKQELDRSLGLKMDAYGFYGTGGTSIPAGLMSSMYSSAIIDIETAYPAGRGIGPNGNRLLPEYGDLLPPLIEERSFGLEANTGAWVMRPAALASALAKRAAAVVPSDNEGPMVDLNRAFDSSPPDRWRGRRVVKTTNILGSLTKGTGTNLSDAFFGIWSHCIVATYGAVMFTQGQDGNTFKRGQYLIRGMMFGDIGFEYPSAFLRYGYVLGSQDQI